MNFKRVILAGTALGLLSFLSGCSGPTKLLKLRLKSGTASELVATGIFIFVGFKPNTGIIKDHIEHDASGYIITDSNMMTSVPGLFAAGDVRAQLTRQVTTAVGDATTAAIAVEKFLTARKSGQAAPKPQPMLIPTAE